MYFSGFNDVTINKKLVSEKLRCLTDLNQSLFSTFVPKGGFHFHTNTSFSKAPLLICESCCHLDRNFRHFVPLNTACPIFFPRLKGNEKIIETQIHDIPFKNLPFKVQELIVFSRASDSLCNFVNPSVCPSVSQSVTFYFVRVFWTESE